MGYSGTCLQTYIPIRSEPKSGAEMVSTLLFGESYHVSEVNNDFLKIVTDFDRYTGWISAGSYSEYNEFNTVNDHVVMEAHGDHQIMYIPCGALIPESGRVEIEGQIFTLDRKLKTYHHLPMAVRMQRLAQSFLNMPYLWGGRSFMGIDCSGFIQVLYKANGIALPRDTSEQIFQGKEIDAEGVKSCDLIFFSKPDSEKVSHVGLSLDKGLIIHASGKVRIDIWRPEGIHMNGQLVYKTLAIKRIL